MGDVEEWLERLGLSRYRAVFAEHDIDREVLPELTEPDLEKLGLLARPPQAAPARDRGAGPRRRRAGAGRTPGGAAVPPPSAAS